VVENITGEEIIKKINKILIEAIIIRRNIFIWLIDVRRIWRGKRRKRRNIKRFWNLW
jgi:hypothetical protein